MSVCFLAALLSAGANPKKRSASISWKLRARPRHITIYQPASSSDNIQLQVEEEQGKPSSKALPVAFFSLLVVHRKYNYIIIKKPRFFSTPTPTPAHTHTHTDTHTDQTKWTRHFSSLAQAMTRLLCSLWRSVILLLEIKGLLIDSNVGSRSGSSHHCVVTWKKSIRLLQLECAVGQCGKQVGGRRPSVSTSSFLLCQWLLSRATDLMARSNWNTKQDQADQWLELCALTKRSFPLVTRIHKTSWFIEAASLKGGEKRTDKFPLSLSVAVISLRWRRWYCPTAWNSFFFLLPFWLPLLEMLLRLVD